MSIGIRARLASLALVVVGFFTLAGVAGAAITVGGATDAGGNYVVTATGDGLAQNLAVTSTATTVVFTAGGGETITAGAGCSGTPGPVTCTFDPATDFTDVFLNGGGDTFTAAAATQDLGLFVAGGSGVDTVTGSPADDILDLKDGEIDGVSSDCGAGTGDLVIRDWGEPYINCEFGSPIVYDVEIGGTPTVGGRISMSYAVSPGGPAVVTQTWLSCATADGAGCIARATGGNYRPTQVDGGRYMIAEVSAGFAEFSFLGVLDSARSAPVLIPGVPSPPPVPSVTFGSFNKRRGSLSIGVSGAGTLRVGPSSRSKYVSTVTRSVSAAGSVSLKIKLTSAGKKQLKKKKKLKVKIKVLFTPTSGNAITATKTLTFKAKSKK